MAIHEIPRDVKGERKNINDIYNKIINICFYNRSNSD